MLNGRKDRGPQTRGEQKYFDLWQEERHKLELLERAEDASNKILRVRIDELRLEKDNLIQLFRTYRRVIT